VSARRRSALWWAAVVAVAVAGLVLRAWNLDFDQRQHLHPDERHWSLTAAAIEREPAAPSYGTVAAPVLNYLDGQRSPTNAYRGATTFVYGPITLAGTQAVAGWLHDGVLAGEQPASFVAHTVDLLGVPLLDEQGFPRFDAGYDIDLIGRLLGALVDSSTVVIVALIGRRIGGRATGLVAAVLAASTVMSIQHAHYFGSEPLLGFVAALTVLATLRLSRGAEAVPAVLDGVLVGAAAGALVAVKLTGAPLAAVPVLACGWLLVTRRRWADLIRLGSVLGAAAVAFRVLYPSAFSGLGLLPSDTFLDDLRRTNELNGAGLPPSIQWAGRIPVLEPLGWLVSSTIGPAIAVAAVLGTIALVRRRHRLGRWIPAVLIASWVIPLVWVLRQSVTTGRYFVPMLPALCACGGYGIVALARHARARGDGLGRAGRAAAGVLVAASVIWATAFVAGVHGGEHTRIAASRWIDENVAAGSVITSESWDDGLPLAIDGVEPDVYVTEQLDLFGTDDVAKVERLAEQLGGVDYVVESSPRVWNSVVRLPSRYPSTIRFFEGLESGALGFERVATFRSPPQLGPVELPSGGVEEAFSVYDHPEVRIWQKTTELTQRDLLAQLEPLAAATAVDVHPDDGGANGAMMLPSESAKNDQIGTFDDDFDTAGSPWLHAFGWFVVAQLIGLCAFAVFAPALRRLPDAGAGIALTLGLAVTTFGTFVLVAWIGLPLDRPVVLGVVAAWVAAGIVATRRHRTLLRGLWHERRTTLLVVQAVIVGTFGVVLLLRAMNPDLWHVYRGGEKLFELEMLTSVLRTRTLPPGDSWFAGGTLNYYYAGYLLLAIPARLLRTTPAVVMSLGLALVAAMAAGAASSAGAAVADAWTRSRGIATGPHPRVARWAGLSAVALVLVVPSTTILGPVARRLTGSEGGAFDWWALSRVIPNSPVVTEFPAWSLLFGDLHPHVIGLPLVLTVITLALAWYRSLVSAATWVSPVALGATTGLMCGLMQATNTWDLPLAVGLVVLVVVVAVATGAPKRRCAMAATTSIAVAVVGWAPYAWRSVVTDAGIEPESLTTPFVGWLGHFGLFIAATLVMAGLMLTESKAIRSRTALVAGLVAVALVGAAVASPPRAVLLSGLGLAAIAFGTAWVVGHRADRPDGAPKASMTLTFLALGLGWSMIAAIELVSVVNDFDRQNTVFKGWYQAWTLMGVGSAAGLVTLAAGARRHRRTSPATASGRAAIATIGAIAVVSLLATTAFVRLAVPGRLEDRVSPSGLSLDALAFLEADDIVPNRDARLDPGNDRTLVRWLQTNVPGRPTIAEAPGPDYGWNGRISAISGLPSVIGWPYHQSQQRRDQEAEIRQRTVDMASIYESGDPTLIESVLQQYDVGYVVFGSAEQAMATPSSRRDLLTSPCLDVVFADGDSFVARVDQVCLGDRPGGLPPRTG